MLPLMLNDGSQITMLVALIAVPHVYRNTIPIPQHHRIFAMPRRSTAALWSAAGDGSGCVLTLI